ncbi:MAG: hypothetical protein JJU33_12745 [Phycisphaerales bacterium]|nr:hypothetical protein [Phycisphaerales bacterium]
MKIRAEKSRNAGIGFGALAIALLAGQAAAQINIPANAPDLATAVSQASSGQTITIDAGSYTGSGWVGVSPAGKDLTITGLGVVVVDLATQGRAMNITGGENITLNNITFTNGDTGLDDEGGTLFITGGSTVTANDVTFDNSFAFFEGGAVFVSSANFNANDCTFQNNEVLDVGGAIAAAQSAVVNISGGVFQNNEAAGGGAIDLTGGAELTVTGNAVFQNNRAISAFGGAIQTASAGLVTLTDVTLQNNESLGEGAAFDFFITDSALTNVTIVDNIVLGTAGVNTFGGATSIAAGDHVWTDVEIRDNQVGDINTGAGGIGAGLSSIGGATIPCTISFTNVDFIDNYANNQTGGAQLGSHTSGTITGGLVSGNRINSGAGAGHLVIGTNVDITFDGVEFRDHFFVAPTGTTFGGAVYVVSTETADIPISLTFNDCLFDGNNADIGAGIGAQATRPAGAGNFAIIEVDNSTFTNNVGLAGAGMRLFGSVGATVTDSLFEDNEVSSVGAGLQIFSNQGNGEFNFSGNTWRNNVSQSQGGAVSASGDDLGDHTLTFSGDLFQGNDSLGVNTAGQGAGGAILHGGAGELNINNCTFDSNTALASLPDSASFGSAISVINGENEQTALNIVGSTFIDNEADLGTAINVQGNAVNGAVTVISANNTYEGNSGLSGAFRAATNTTVVSTSDMFIGNSSLGSGSAFAILNAQGEVTAGGFFDNAAGDFGAVLSGADGQVLLVNSVLADNTSENAAAAVASVFGEMTVLNSTLANNGAFDELGNRLGAPQAAIFMDPDEIGGQDNRIINSIVWNDAADVSTLPDIQAQQGSNVSIEFSLIRGGETNVAVIAPSTLTYAASNVDGDPQFANAAGGDFRVDPSSPAVDAGSNSAYNALSSATTDYLGGTRIVGSAINMGAIEETSGAPTCPPDLNGDGVVDADDFFLFLQFFASGDPRADFNSDGVIDAQDFFDFLAAFAAGC